ncbi:MAG: hypothetical protein RSC76_05540 [Oscillospiraceae bacterium]
MSKLIEYKCPNCSGAITFDSTSQQMKCPFCGSEFAVDTLKAYDEALKNDGKDSMDWDGCDKETGSGDWKEGEQEGLLTYVCDACGGEIVGDATMAATSCPYCGNSVIIAKQFSGMLRPDYVLPFKLDKNAAKNALAGFLKGKLLLPKLFKSQNHIDSITGLYVPYWLFDCDSDTNVRFNATRFLSWREGEYDCTRTDHYMLLRAGDMSFEKVPVDGSSKMDNNYTEAIEPFDYSEAVDFQTAYLSGYLADKYDVKAEECAPRANERIKESAVRALEDTTVGYATCVPASVNIQLKQGDIRYALLPMWMLNTKYKDKIYTFAMNGQTGKFVGELPIDRFKFWAWLCGTFVGLAAIALPIALFLF